MSEQHTKKWGLECLDSKPQHGCKSDIKDGKDGKEGKDDGISWGRIGPTERHDS